MKEPECDKKFTIFLKEIADQFNHEGKIVNISALSGGFINTTYLVETDCNSPDYILQKKNKEIFKDVPAMMDNIMKVTEFLRNKIEKSGGDSQREVMKIIFTSKNTPYFVDCNGEFWTMSIYIPDTVSFESASHPELSRKGGEGIGKFLLLLHDFDQDLYPTIKGFHDLGHRFSQWDETLKRDAAKRVKDLTEEINWIEARRERKREFWQLVETGVIPKRVTHNDTKLSNILFNKNEEVQCVIDLDTVMSNTALADFGDAIRSFANTSKEDEKDLSLVGLDKKMFTAYTEGYLSQVANILTDKEIEYLPFAPLYITYEQVMRFLMDYIDGDIYYKTSYPGHNLVRTHSQMKLLESLEMNYDFMKDTVENIINRYKIK